MIRLILLFALVACAMSVSAQIKVASNGNVGIGVNTPAYRLDVQGEVRFGKWGTESNWDQLVLDWNNEWGAPELYCKSDGNWCIGKATKRVNRLYVYGVQADHYWGGSDEKLKENIAQIDSALTKVRKLSGHTYNFKQSVIPEKEYKGKKMEYGFIAQELQTVFPELVLAPDSPEDHFYVNYDGMIPVLVEAIKEQQVLIEDLQKEVKKLTKSSSNNKSASVTASDLQPETTPTATLGQNTPNPFTAETEISYYVPENAQTAVIYVFNLNGTLVRTYPISQTGNGQITINGSELQAGMYIYTLAVDKTAIDSKKMILTE